MDLSTNELFYLVDEAATILPGAHPASTRA